MPDTPTVAQPAKKRRFRFSLLTLLAAVLLAGSGAMLYRDWAPWVESSLLTYPALGSSSDGRLLVTKSEEPGVATVWDLGAGKVVCQLRGHGQQDRVPPICSGISSGHFSSDDRRILTVGEDQTARVWDAATGRELHRMGGWNNPIRSAWLLPQEDLVCVLCDDPLMAVDPDGTRVQQQNYEVRSARSGGCLFRLQGIPYCYSDDGRYYLLDHGPRPSGPGLKPWRIPSGTEVALPGQVVSLNFPDGRNQVVISNDGKLRLWDLDAGQPMRDLEAPTRTGSGPFMPLFAPDGRRIVGGTDIWDATTGARLPAQTLAWDDLYFSKDSRRVLLWKRGALPEVWDLVEGRRIRSVEQTGAGPSESSGVFSHFSPDGTRILTWSNAGGARIFDTESGRRIFVMPERAEWAYLAGLKGEFMVTTGRPAAWFRRRPEWWWGVAWLPEFWLTVLFAGALGWSLRRDGRTL
jgi:WD40 repeat protein